MLGIKGTTRLWYVSSITNMRFGKYRLFSEVEALGRNPYNGDCYLFMSKNRHTMKLIRYKDHKRHLYDITHDNAKFMKLVIENDEILYELQYKYFVALLECPVTDMISI
ncbi:MAG: IS66 family insertion sequence element accessory protein TnpB [Bacteroides sp.]